MNEHDVDRLGQHAGAAVRHVVATAELRLYDPSRFEDVPRRSSSHGRNGLYAFAGAFAVMAILVGLAGLLRPTVAGDRQEVVLTTPEPTAPVSTAPASTAPVSTASTETETTTTVPETTTTAPIDTEPPFLVIERPTDGEVVHEEKLRFEGRTEPGARVFAGPYEADVDAEGRWSIVLILQKGANRATLSAVDAAGNETQASVGVVYEPPTPAPPKEEKPPAEEPAVDEKPFSAHFTYGSCSETPPYDVYYGTGTPGTLVTVTSPYGSGATEIGDDGTWELRVEFPDAVYGKTFAVKVKHASGAYEVFEFVSLAG